MLHHSRAVYEGARGPLIVCDLPFGSYVTPQEAAVNAVRMLKEGGADMVKLEGGTRVVEQVEQIRKVRVTCWYILIFMWCVCVCVVRVCL